MSETKIIHLKPNSDGDIRTFTIHKGKFCTHKAVEVDVDEREVRCQRCNAVVDAFDYVLSLASEENTHFFNLDQLKKNIKSLQLEQERLEKNVRNLKARIRRNS